MTYHMNMFGVCLIQILVLGVMFATARTSSLPCFHEDELEEKAQKKLKHLFEQASHPEPESTPAQCPVGRYTGLGKHLSDRSISPWRYVSVTNMDRYPQTIVVAQCLCSGCITITQDLTPTENFTYNSVAVEQSKTFLKKELCSDGKRYRLVPHPEPVAVGCTCAKPRN